MIQFPRRIRPVVVVTLCFALFASLAAAESPPRNPGPRLEQPRNLPGSLRDILPSLLILFWGKPACGIDPHGACGSGTPEPAGQGALLEPGCGLDPGRVCIDAW